MFWDVTVIELALILRKCKLFVSLAGRNYLPVGRKYKMFSYLCTIWMIQEEKWHGGRFTKLRYELELFRFKKLRSRPKIRTGRSGRLFGVHYKIAYKYLHKACYTTYYRQCVSTKISGCKLSLLNRQSISSNRCHHSVQRRLLLQHLLRLYRIVIRTG